LAAHTNTAVDNIILKLMELVSSFASGRIGGGQMHASNLKVMRLGSQAAVHTSVQPFHINALAATCSSFEEFSELCSNTNVVACTCLGIHHEVMRRKSFDLCIIDEASQISEAACIGAISCAKTFVLVGDHYQLPPLVESARAQEMGMGVSLFRRLSSQHPRLVVYLNRQYRMNRDICSLVNHLVYGGSLLCANDAVARRTLKFSKALPTTSDLDRWCTKILEANRSVVFVNTDDIDALEISSGGVVSNPTEASILCALLARCIGAGIPSDSIGVITPFRAQLRLLKVNFHTHFPTNFNEFQLTAFYTNYTCCNLPYVHIGMHQFAV
jgi:DNA replication ATP-dependent helicase Dna2